MQFYRLLEDKILAYLLYGSRTDNATWDCLCNTTIACGVEERQLYQSASDAGCEQLK